jgi:hypothetical protein
MDMIFEFDSATIWNGNILNSVTSADGSDEFPNRTISISCNFLDTRSASSGWCLSLQGSQSVNLDIKSYWTSISSLMRIRGGYLGRFYAKCPKFIVTANTPILYCMLQDWTDITKPLGQIVIEGDLFQTSPTATVPMLRTELSPEVPNIKIIGNMYAQRPVMLLTHTNSIRESIVEIYGDVVTLQDFDTIALNHGGDNKTKVRLYGRVVNKSATRYVIALLGTKSIVELHGARIIHETDDRPALLSANVNHEVYCYESHFDVKGTAELNDSTGVGLNFGAVNCITNKDLDADTVDIWGGLTTIANFKL